MAAHLPHAVTAVHQPHAVTQAEVHGPSPAALTPAAAVDMLAVADIGKQQN